VPRLPLLLALLPACVRTVPLGPDPGECAVVPESGSYAWGQIGIGNCLAGPADVQFVEQDGKTWLAVTNSDPYRSFGTGSLLMIDWDSIDFSVGKNLLPDPDGSSDTSLDAHALVLDLFAGDVGWLPDRDLAIVPTRLSEASDTRVHLDRAQVVDLAEPDDPTLWGVDDTIKLRDDPQPVVVDTDAELAYVGNLTDHSVSVINWAADRPAVEGEVVPAGESCDGQCALALVDVAPIAALEGGALRDPTSPGFAEVANLGIEEVRALVDDTWTLTWIDGTYRVWAEEDAPDSPGAHGLVRWTSGGVDGVYLESALGIELGPFIDVASVDDPYFALEAGVPVLWFADAGQIREATNIGAASDWAVVEGETALDGLPLGVFLGSPSVVLTGDALTIFYDQRPAAGADATIGRTVSEDGATFVFDDATPLLDPAILPGFASFENPFAMFDPVSNRYRLYFSGRRNDDSWSILLSESTTGTAWQPPAVVLEVPGRDVAAPTVQYVNGRYAMWLAAGDGTAWSVATSSSADGKTWSDPVDLFTPTREYDPLDPPRPGVEAASTAGWSIEGADHGIQPIVVFSGAHVGLDGLGFEVPAGHEFSNDVLGTRDGARGISPGSVVNDRMYVTGIRPNGRSAISALEQTVAGTWLPVAQDLIPIDAGGNETGAGSPAVFRDGGTWHMIYAAYDADGAASMRQATSDDGLTWTPLGGDLSPSTDDWDSVAQLPHGVEALDNGGYRVFFGGSDGELWRIGAIVADQAEGPWRREEGELDPWVFGPGTPASFDDSGVKDPWIAVIDGETHLYYAGFDGAAWHLGHAARDGTGAFVRRIAEGEVLSLPAMSGQLNTFSAAGVDSPVAVPDGDRITMWYAGTDGFEPRVGLGFADADDPEIVYPTARIPEPGDAMDFTTARGDKPVSAIRLDQSVHEFTTDGIGMSAMIPDWERGFLYVTSKLASFVYVIDIRDDSTLGWSDANYLDLEGIVRVPSETGTLGFRGGVLSPSRDRGYFDARSPDQIFVLDLGRIEDNDAKEVIELAPIASLPVRTLAVNEGPPTLSLIGASNGALSTDERWLFVPEFRSNTVDVFDLDVGPFGTLVNEIPYVGENPHLVRISPDGRYAVIANYTGEVIDGASYATLAILDIDPASPTAMEVVTWIANR
jgi:DNA-binding beta-propeller fold protein YncE